MAIHDNLIDIWRMDETSGTRRGLVRGNNLTDNGGVGYAAGVLGNAAVFDAAKVLYRNSNSMLECGNVDHTFSCWVYMTSKPAQYQGIICKYLVAGTNEYALYYDYVNDRILWRPASSTNAAFNNPSLNTWYHLLCWWEAATKTAGLRVNDASENTVVTASAAVASTNQFEIGSFDQRNNPNIGFRGRIDEVYFWKRLLTSAEKTQMYNLFDYPWGATNNRSLRGIASGISRGV
jgi:hypothetical protein